jgi:hypothetical protein
VSLLRKWAPLLIRVVVVGALAWWLLSKADLNELLGAVRRLPLWAFGGALALVTAAIALSTLRWRMLMRAFGATHIPSLPSLLRLVFVGIFYNTYVPGAVGGDVVRAVVSRQCFAEPAASSVVVLLDRVIGLSALGVVFLVALPFGPTLVDPATAAPWLAALIGAGVLALVAARMSGLLSRWWKRVPRVHTPTELIKAFVVSMACHGLSISAFVLMSAGLELPLYASDLLVVVPLGMVASVVPIAIAGIGPREAALVGLLGLVGLGQTEALALSLGYAAALLIAAALGGLLQLLGGKLTVEGGSS